MPSPSAHSGSQRTAPAVPASPVRRLWEWITLAGNRQQRQRIQFPSGNRRANGLTEFAKVSLASSAFEPRQAPQTLASAHTCVRTCCADLYLLGSSLQQQSCNLHWRILQEIILQSSRRPERYAYLDRQLNWYAQKPDKYGEEE